MHSPQEQISGMQKDSIKTFLSWSASLNLVSCQMPICVHGCTCRSTGLKKASSSISNVSMHLASAAGEKVRWCASTESHVLVAKEEALGSPPKRLVAIRVCANLIQSRGHATHSRNPWFLKGSRAVCEILRMDVCTLCRYLAAHRSSTITCSL